MEPSSVGTYRRLKDYGISPDDYSDISPSEILKMIKVDHPNDGEVLMKGHLLRLGMKVRRSELRASIHRIDHERTVEQRSHIINRRTYMVAAPNVFLEPLFISSVLTTTNRLPCWKHLVWVFPSLEFVIPDCIRSDHGGENVRVCWRFIPEMILVFLLVVQLTTKELKGCGGMSTGVLVC